MDIQATPSSINLSDLPYTGFDLGPVYNSLYWVVLLVWSLIIAFIIIKNKHRFARLFAGLAKIFILQKQSKQIKNTDAEPKVLEERVVRFNPLIDPVASKLKSAHVHPDTNATNINTISNMQKDILQAVHSIKKEAERITEEKPETKAEIAKRVSEIVEEELAISRMGQMPDEFSSDDFYTVDFDGVNPDDFWKPKQTSETISKNMRKTQIDTTIHRQNTEIPKPSQQQKTNKQNDINTSAYINTQNRHVSKIQEMQKVYEDSIELDTTSEYPKLVLKREDVTNY